MNNFLKINSNISIFTDLSNLSWLNVRFDSSFKQSLYVLKSKKNSEIPFCISSNLINIIKLPLNKGFYTLKRLKERKVY